MEQEFIERLTKLEVSQQNMQEDIKELKESNRDTNLVVNKLSEAFIRVENKIDNIVTDVSHMKESNNKLEKEIEEVQNAGKINIMKDIIKPIVISAVSGGGVAAVLLNFIK